MNNSASINIDEMYSDNVPVGRILSSVRKQYSQTLEDIEKSLHIRSAMIDAIERGDFDALPGHAYALGFIRTYSEYLGLDAERIVNLFKSQAATSKCENIDHLTPAQLDINVPNASLLISCVVFLLVLNSLLGAGQLNKPQILALPIETIDGSIIKGGIPSAASILPLAEDLYN